MSVHRKYNSELQPTRYNVSLFIYFYRCSTCFRRFLRPSSGAHNCTHCFMYCQPILLLAAIVGKMERKTMNKPTQNKHPLCKIANDALVDLPKPSIIRFWWNFVSLLGICLVTQIVTGLFLAIHYCPNTDTAFSRVRHTRWFKYDRDWFFFCNHNCSSL